MFLIVTINYVSVFLPPLTVHKLGINTLFKLQYLLPSELLKALSSWTNFQTVIVFILDGGDP